VFRLFWAGRRDRWEKTKNLKSINKEKNKKCLDKVAFQR
jgi:hypothetical protein